jgi:general secretion pathway protein G
MVAMRKNGFTAIELMIALAILATILAVAVPRYFGNLDTARESALREDLYLLRDAIDKYYADNGAYPDTLEALVTKKYLRAIPVDPFTRSPNSWVIQPPTDGAAGAVFDVHSAAPNTATDGTWFKDW